MLHPLLSGRSLTLVFQEAAAGAELHTDQGKLAQILRNFVSNAIKYTEQGEIVVSAALLPDGAHMRFAVSDTGIGIEARYLETIFEEFSQIESHLQTRVKGTGLGLPLCRKLGELLGGSVSVSSVAGQGSVFSLVIPVTFAEPADPYGPAPINQPTM
jgi:signal transduction histidine kinase